MAKSSTTDSGQDNGGAAYPYEGLSRCVKLGTIVRDHGGQDVPKAVIASEMGIAKDAPVLYQVVASAKCFGIVEGSRGLSLTETARDYFFPQSENATRLAELRFFSTPKAFKLTIERFDGGKLPASSILANLMQRQFSVPKSWCGRTAGLFASGAADLGIIDPNGFLRYGVALHSAERGTQRNESQPASVAMPQVEQPEQAQHYTMKAETGRFAINAPSTAKAVLPNANVWTYTEGGGAVRLETTESISFALWDRLKRYVEVLKPSKEETNEETSKRDG